MDPNALLARIHAAVTNQTDCDEVDFWCEDLFNWLAKGGFAPTWEDFPLGSSYYRCREIAIKRGERAS